MGFAYIGILVTCVYEWNKICCFVLCYTTTTAKWLREIVRNRLKCRVFVDVKLKEVCELFFLCLYEYIETWHLHVFEVRCKISVFRFDTVYVALWVSMFIFTKQCKRVYFDGHLWWTKWTNLCTVMGDDDTDILLHFDFDTMSLTQLFW